jgi:hypothetical protein
LGTLYARSYIHTAMAANTVVVRYRDAAGVHRLPPLSADATVGALLSALAAATGLAPGRLRCKGGFPPSPLDLSDPARPLSAVPVRSGDTLLVEEGAAATVPLPPTVPSATTGTGTGTGLGISTRTSAGAGLGVVVRRPIDDDNSCLFNAVGCACASAEGGIKADWPRGGML